MTVNEVYQLVLIALDKNLENGYISPDDFNRTINQAQRSYVDYLLGQYPKYQPGRPTAPVSLALNERIRTSLTPLIYGTMLTIDGTGLSPYPSDFEQVDAMWSVYGLYRIRFTQQDSLWSKYHSVIDPIQTNPVYLIKNEGFQFYPETLAFARMSYIRTAPGIYWRYTLDGNGLPVYDPITSVNPVWSDVDIFNIIVRQLEILGTKLQLGVVMQYSNDIKKTGQ